VIRALSPSDRIGHTLVEVVLALLLLSVVSASAYAVLRSQRRFYAAQLEIAAARDVARIAVEILSGELRPASPLAGDLYAIAPDSLALRSFTGLGVVCDISGDVIGLRRVTGAFGDAKADSVLVYLERGFDTAQDDGWAATATQRVGAAAGGRCPDGRVPDVELVVERVIEGATVGSAVRGFRPYVYRLYEGRDGRWWLGQRLREGRFQPVVGPFARGGLRFEPLTAAGRPTLDPRRVVQVRISVIARSYHRLPGRDAPEFFEDSLSTIVFLRNAREQGSDGS
jgi:hypothetical protein